MCSVAHLHCVQVEHLAASMRNQLNIEVGALGPSDAIRNMEGRSVCVCERAWEQKGVFVYIIKEMISQHGKEYCRLGAKGCVCR